MTDSKGPRWRHFEGNDYLPCGHCSQEGICRTNDGHSCAVCSRDGRSLGSHSTCACCKGMGVQQVEDALERQRKLKLRESVFYRVLSRLGLVE